MNTPLKITGITTAVVSLSTAVLTSSFWISCAVGAICAVVMMSVFFGIYYYNQNHKDLQDNIQVLKDTIEDSKSRCNEFIRKNGDLLLKVKSCRVDLPCNYCAHKTPFIFLLSDDTFECESCGARNAIHTHISTARLASPIHALPTKSAGTSA